MSETVRLYHFVNAKYGIENIQYRRLKVAFANQVNDVFEMQPFDFGDSEMGSKNCYAWNIAINEHSMGRGFISFSKRWSVPTMWAHYADNHKGICLGFDVPTIWNGQAGHLDKVKYIKKPKKMGKRMASCQKYIDKKVEIAKKTKSCHWKYEKEWRVWNSLGALEKEEKRVNPSMIFFTNFHEHLVLKEVIFGCKSDSSTRSKAQALISPSDGVQFTTAGPSFRAFKMVAEGD